MITYNIKLGFLGFCFGLTSDFYPFQGFFYYKTVGIINEIMYLCNDKSVPFRLACFIYETEIAGMLKIML